MVEIDTADAGRLALHVSELGAGEPVLMLHGWPQHAGCWRRVAPLVAERHRVICPDLRGFGGSDAPGRGRPADVRLRRGRAARCARHRSGGPGRSRLGRLLRLPAGPGTPRADHRIRRLQHALVGAAHAAHRGRGLAQLVRVRDGRSRQAAARPAARPVRKRDPRPRPLGGGGLGLHTAAGAAQSARATELLYRAYLRTFVDFTLGRGSDPGRLTVPARVLHGTRDPAVSKELLAGDHSSHADDLEVELVECAGHFVPEERRSWWPSGRWHCSTAPGRRGRALAGRRVLTPRRTLKGRGPLTGDPDGCRPRLAVAQPRAPRTQQETPMPIAEWDPVQFASIESGKRRLGLGLTMAVVLAVLAAPAGASPPAAEVEAVGAKSRSVPTCPPRYRAVTRTWRGWYACYRKRARKRWVRPTGCRAGYQLWVRKKPRRAWRCKPRSASEQPGPTPQPSPPGVSDQQLINDAFNAAVADGNADLADTQYMYRGRIYRWWINAGVNSDRNVVSPVYTPYTQDPDGYYQPEGCLIESPGVARCTLAEAVYNGPDSSIPESRTVKRWLWYAEYIGGKVYTRSRSADYPASDWYYICYGPPQWGSIPTCS